MFFFLKKAFLQILNFVNAVDKTQFKSDLSKKKKKKKKIKKLFKKIKIKHFINVKLISNAQKQ